MTPLQLSALIQALFCLALSCHTVNLKFRAGSPVHRTVIPMHSAQVFHSDVLALLRNGALIDLGIPPPLQGILHFASYGKSPMWS